MTPDQLAALHAAAFDTSRPWSANEFKTLLQGDFIQLFTEAHGFALVQTIADEAELLTIAVDPIFQRQGIARALLAAWLDPLSNPPAHAFLEVASDNTAALALYAEFGFVQVATRHRYYARKDADAVDAIVMRREKTTD